MTTRKSLLGGRHQHDLADHEIRRATNTFMGLEPRIAVQYDRSATTAFSVKYDDDGDQYGQVTFGPDIYPGSSVTDPNSALSMIAAAAHELTHHNRWENKTQLNELELMHLDEAITSLEAAIRYSKSLSEHDREQLIRDAIQRIHLYIDELQATPTSS